MEKFIKNIVDENLTNKEKEKYLDKLSEQIELAKNIISGKFKHCPFCDDYYLTKSFQFGKKTENVRICVYDDPINSGGSEYEDGYADITFDICPKGHEIETSRMERRKR